MKTLVLYPVIIIGVLLFSGINKERTFYNKHLITLYGTTIPSNTPEKSKAFYSKLLELPLISESEDLHEYLLPDNRVLSLRTTSEEISPSPKEVLTIRVRNGLSQLQAQFKKRIENSGELYQQVEISEITKSKRGKEFYLKDPSHNKVLFFQRGLFSKR
jgi:catechol-2,3-dioxygenase